MKEKDGLLNRLIVRRSRYRGLERYIFAQAKHESANFDSVKPWSPLYRKYNNIFGMKTRYKNEPGVKASDGGFYRVYLNDGEAVQALLDWMERNDFPRVILSPESYATELKARRYFTDTVTNYVAGLKHYY